MSRSTKQALAVLGAASITLQTIRNSFEIGPQYRGKIDAAEQEIKRVYAAWPRARQHDGAWSIGHLEKWTEYVKKDIRLGQWVMCTLAAVSVQAITDLYERPTSRHQRPLLDPLMEMVAEVFYHVEGGWKASAESNELAGKMLTELYGLIGWGDVKVNWPWRSAE